MLQFQNIKTKNQKKICDQIIHIWNYSIAIKQTMLKNNLKNYNHN